MTCWPILRGKFYYVGWSDRPGEPERRRVMRDPATGNKVTRKSDADRWLASFRRDYEQKAKGEAVIVANPDWESFWTAYTAKVKGNYRPKSWEAVQWAKRHAERVFSPKRLADITHDGIMAYRDTFTGQPATFNGLHRALSRVYILGRKHNLHALENPWRGVEYMAETRKRLPVLAVEDVESLCWWAAWHSQQPYGPNDIVQAHNIWAVFVLGGYFGLRAAEIENARWEWIDWTRETFTVQQDHGFVTKAQKERTMPLFDSGARWLWHARRTSGYIFRPEHTTIVAGYGRRAEFKRSFAYVCKLAGKPDVYPHLLRHSWVSNLLCRGVNPFKVAKYAGHSTLWIQERYAHLIEDEGMARVL